MIIANGASGGNFKKYSLIKVFCKKRDLAFRPLQASLSLEMDVSNCYRTWQRPQVGFSTPIGGLLASIREVMWHLQPHPHNNNCCPS